MQSEYRILEDKRGEMKVTFTKEEFQSIMNEVYRENARYFDVPGFRRGKAPIGVALRMYGESTLYDDALDKLFKRELPELVKKHDVDLVAPPELEIDEIGYNKGLSATLLYTLTPDVELGEYKGIPVYFEDTEITDEDVDKRLKEIQESNGRWVPVEEGTAAEEGHRVTMDYVGYHDGEPFEGGSAEGQSLELGSHSFIPGFEEGLVGAHVGDHLDLELTFPEEYHAEDLAGEDVVFKVDVKGIAQKELPELDDDFAMDVSEFDTMDEYRDSVREELQKDADEHRDMHLDDQLLKQVVDNATIDVPDVMIEQAIDDQIQQQDLQMRQYGMSFKQFVEMTGQNMDDIRKSFRDNAERTVRTGLVLDKISEVEDLAPTDEEKEAELERFSELYGMTVDTLKSQFVDREEVLYSDLRRKKVLEFLREHRVELDEPPVEEEVEVKVPEENEDSDDSDESEDSEESQEKENSEDTANSEA